MTIGFTQRFIACLNDPRARERVDHGAREERRSRLRDTDEPRDRRRKSSRDAQ